MGQVHRRKGVLIVAVKKKCAEMWTNGSHAGTQAVLRCDITCYLLLLHYPSSCDWLVMSDSGSLSHPFSRKDI